MRDTIDSEAEAVRAALAAADLGSATPVRLATTHRSIFLVASHGIVAKAQALAPGPGRGDDIARVSREIAVTRHLADRHAPVIAPLDARRAGPHLAGSSIVTLWPYLADARPAEDCDAAFAADLLAAVHRALIDYPGVLPGYTQALDGCVMILAGARIAAVLDAADRALLAAHLSRLRERVAARAVRSVRLHGDVHLGNLLVAEPMGLWTDFEDACLGPPELDIAGLPEDAWGRFADADRTLIGLFRDLRSVCVAIWCWADLERSPAVAEAARHHLERVRAMR